MSSKGSVTSVNISEVKGTIKEPVPQIVIDKTGVQGDAHAGPWHRQVSVLASEDIDRFSIDMERKVLPGEFAENITLSGIDLSKVAIMDRFCVNEVVLEVTQIGKKCHGTSCAIFQEIGKCVMPNKGLFCRVIHSGEIKPGDMIEHFPRPFKVLIVTLSDRAFAGQYTDRSGPAAKKIIEESYRGKRWHLEIENELMADDPDKLRDCLQNAIAENVDVIFTLGGTGIGLRDITPETVAALADKTIPGIMENIRIKYGSNKPSVLLSRSIAAVSGQTQIYTLPGSVKAVEEYLSEILKSLEHAYCMLHGLDIH